VTYIKLSSYLLKVHWCRSIYIFTYVYIYVCRCMWTTQLWLITKLPPSQPSFLHSTKNHEQRKIQSYKVRLSCSQNSSFFLAPLISLRVRINIFSLKNHEMLGKYGIVVIIMEFGAKCLVSHHSLALTNRFLDKVLTT
jgi:hypothetical protein